MIWDSSKRVRTFLAWFRWWWTSSWGSLFFSWSRWYGRWIEVSILQIRCILHWFCWDSSNDSLTSVFIFLLLCLPEYFELTWLSVANIFKRFYCDWWCRGRLQAALLDIYKLYRCGSDLLLLELFKSVDSFPKVMCRMFWGFDRRALLWLRIWHFD